MIERYLSLLASATERDREIEERRRVILSSKRPPAIGNPGQLRDRWWKWHLQNPQVYERIEHEALLYAETGKKRYGVWPIVGHLRHMENLRTTGDDYKISNDFQALFARLFIHLHPEHSQLFVTKEMKR